MNNLNVFGYNIQSLKRIKSWPYNIKQFFRNIKYAYQRITKGYCDADCWALDSFYSELFYHTLKQLADKTHGMPGKWSLEGKAFDDWENYLREMAEHFLNTQEDNLDIPINQEVMKLWEEMNLYRGEPIFIGTSKGTCKLEYDYTDQEQFDIAQKRWLDKEEEAAEFRINEKDKAFDMMKEVFFDLWD